MSVLWPVAACGIVRCQSYDPWQPVILSDVSLMTRPWDRPGPEDGRYETITHSIILYFMYPKSRISLFMIRISADLSLISLYPWANLYPISALLSPVLHTLWFIQSFFCCPCERLRETWRTREYPDLQWGSPVSWLCAMWTVMSRGVNIVVVPANLPWRNRFLRGDSGQF